MAAGQIGHPDKRVINRQTCLENPTLIAMPIIIVSKEQCLLWLETVSITWVTAISRLKQRLQTFQELDGKSIFHLGNTVQTGPIVFLI